ncbi:MAG: alpha/beta hydrolase [Spirochaetales bacterium]|uniref:Alpha/beta hydrolase n=1 Tax=Candidatus Thalassospirochaeta sargassi TaxID=3119039 RepID=A0AAJ1IF41_9SPIO|nr:alpha/beta hydrolase [Spirochaetales bacterium]
MKVTRQMLHKDLRRYYTPASLTEKIMRRKTTTRLMNLLINKVLRGRTVSGLDCREIYVPSSDGECRIRTIIFKPADAPPDLPVMLFLHGGGYITGLPEMYTDLIEGFIRARPCVVVAPDYRKAFTKPFPAGFNDCYDTLLWLRGHGDAIGVNPGKLIIAGTSAGGGLTAAVTLKARDTMDMSVAFQMPLYGMIDDRQPFDPARQIESPAWGTATNLFGWQSYLAGIIKEGAEVPAYASPARNHDYSDFPPTITFVGSLDPFLHETTAYVEELKQAGIPTEFRIYEGCFHGFDQIAPNTSVGKDALDFMYSSYCKYYDRYM